MHRPQLTCESECMGMCRLWHVLGWATGTVRWHMTCCERATATTMLCAWTPSLPAPLVSSPLCLQCTSAGLPHVGVHDEWT